MYTVAYFSSVLFVVFSKSVHTQMRNKGLNLAGDLAWSLSKSSSGFRIDEPK